MGTMGFWEVDPSEMEDIKKALAWPTSVSAIFGLPGMYYRNEALKHGLERGSWLGLVKQPSKSHHH
jgi:hypothetical protein